MTYSESEDGFNDTIELSLQKLRCSMQTMQEHEKLGGEKNNPTKLPPINSRFFRAIIHEDDSLRIRRADS